MFYPRNTFLLPLFKFSEANWSVAVCDKLGCVVKGKLELVMCTSGKQSLRRSHQLEHKGHRLYLMVIHCQCHGPPCTAQGAAGMHWTYVSVVGRVTVGMQNILDRK